MLANVESPRNKAVSLFSSVQIFWTVAVFIRVDSFANVLNATIVGKRVQTSHESSFFVKKVAQRVDIFIVHEIVNCKIWLSLFVGSLVAECSFDAARIKFNPSERLRFCLPMSKSLK